MLARTIHRLKTIREPAVSEPYSAETAESAESAKPSLRERYLRLPRRPRTRWIALGATAVVLAGGAGVCVAAHHWERMHREGDQLAVAQLRGGHNKHGGHGGRNHQGGQGFYGSGDASQGRGQQMEGRGQQMDGALAPAPLPALPADQAAQKAAAAVPGGRVDELKVVGQQGGGSAWQLEVLGQDGVRHLVTVDGVSGSVTSNTSATDGPGNGN